MEAERSDKTAWKVRTALDLQIRGVHGPKKVADSAPDEAATAAEVLRFLDITDWSKFHANQYQNSQSSSRLSSVLLQWNYALLS